MARVYFTVRYREMAIVREINRKTKNAAVQRSTRLHRFSMPLCCSIVSTMWFGVRWHFHPPSQGLQARDAVYTPTTYIQLKLVSCAYIKKTCRVDRKYDQCHSGRRGGSSCFHSARSEKIFVRPTPTKICTVWAILL